MRPLRALLASLAIGAAAAAPTPGTFAALQPLIPASAVAVVSISGLEDVFTKYRAFTERVAPVCEKNGIDCPPTPRFRSLREAVAASKVPIDGVNFNASFVGAFLVHAAGKPLSPFVPGFFAAPHVSGIFLLPGVTALHLAALPELQLAGDGIAGHFRFNNFKVTVGQWGAVGVLVVGPADFADLSVAPNATPNATMALPPGAVATMDASALALSVDLSPLDVLLRPYLAASHSLFSLVDVALGLFFEYDNSENSLAAIATRLGLTRATLGAVYSLATELHESALEYVMDARIFTVGVAVKGDAGLHAGVFTAFKPGSATGDFVNAAFTSTAESLWPDLPDSPAVIFASANTISPVAVAQFEAAFYGPVRALLRKDPSPTSVLLLQIIDVLSQVNGPSDGVQLAVLDNGAGDPTHAGCPPDLPAGAIVSPGIVTLFARGNTEAAVWARHDGVERALRTAVGNNMPWGSRDASIAVHAGGGGVDVADGECVLCTEGTGYWCTTTNRCVNSRDYSCPYHATVVYSGSCPPPTAVQLAAAAAAPALATITTTNSTRTIGGVTFTQRRILVAPSADAPPVIIDTNVGTVGGRVLAFSLVADADVLPFVLAAAGGDAAAAVPRFADAAGVPDALGHCAAEKTDVLAVRPAAAISYAASLTGQLGHGRGTALTDRLRVAFRALREAGVVVAVTSGTEESAIRGEAFFDCAVRFSCVDDRTLARASKLTPHTHTHTAHSVFSRRWTSLQV